MNFHTGTIHLLLKRTFQAVCDWCICQNYLRAYPSVYFWSRTGPKITQDDQPACAENNRGIPLDLMCSLHVHNGQTIPTDGDGVGTVGLGGTLSIYDYNSCPSLLSYEEMSTLIPGSGDADDRETVGSPLSMLNGTRCNKWLKRL